jgi:hypothetical protein
VSEAPLPVVDAAQLARALAEPTRSTAREAVPTQNPPSRRAAVLLSVEVVCRSA